MPLLRSVSHHALTACQIVNSRPAARLLPAALQLNAAHCRLLPCRSQTQQPLCLLTTWAMCRLCSAALLLSLCLALAASFDEVLLDRAATAGQAKFRGLRGGLSRRRLQEPAKISQASETTEPLTPFPEVGLSFEMCTCSALSMSLLHSLELTPPPALGEMSGPAAGWCRSAFQKAD